MSEVFKVVLETIKQLGSTIPDSILFGTIVLFFVTLNTSYGVFAIFILELIMSHKLISWMFTETRGPDQPKLNIACYSGYKSVREKRAVPQHQYPSYSFFSITAMATYLGLSTQKFNDTMKTMEIEWQGRPIIAYLFIIAIVTLFIVVRLVSACDGLTELVIAFVCAVLCGGIFFKLNVYLLGDEAVNFLGLPLLDAQVTQTDPIYVCQKDI